MVQHFHRGIYEHLWSEHRYLVFARSLKHHDNTRAKLGRVVHVFSFLKSLARAALEPKTEMTQAVLHLYMHIKDQLDRKQRMELVEKILASDDEAMRRIYQLGITASDNAVIGSRLFFTGKALFKIWDNIDTPGLWICMGCFQIHLDPQEALQRVSILSGLSLPAILKVMETLSQGIPESDYSLLNERLRSALENHLMVAKSGGTAWLSPRVPVRFCSADRWVELPPDQRKRQDLPWRLTGITFPKRQAPFPSSKNGKHGQDTSKAPGSRWYAAYVSAAHPGAF